MKLQKLPPRRIWRGGKVGFGTILFKIKTNTVDAGQKTSVFVLWIICLSAAINICAMLNEWKLMKKVNFYSNSGGQKVTWTWPLHHLEICHIVEMLEYLFNEERENFSDYRPEEPTIPTDTRAGFMTRIIAYTMLVTNLENILMQIYRVTKAHIKNFGCEDIMPPKNKIKGLKKEIEVYDLYRNKIFAHASFSNNFQYRPFIPFLEGLFKKITGKDIALSEKLKDGQSTQITSLLYLSGCMLGIQTSGFHLGNSYLVVNQDKPTQLPPLDITNGGHTLIRKHFTCWAKIFSDIIIELEKCDLEAIKKKGNLSRVDFK